MDITFVIPTLGDGTLLASMLNSIRQYVNERVEIIIVRQTFRGPLPEVYYSLRDLHDISCHDVDFRGLSIAKNYAIKHATKKFILFLDDDAEILPTTCATLRSLISSSKAVGYFGKTIDHDGNDTVSVFSKDSSFLSFENYRGRIIECPSVFVKEVIARYLFDERMGAGQFHGAEEGHDLVLRMLEKHEVLFYTPDLSVYHPNKTLEYDTAQAVRRGFYYRAGFAYLCAKHGMGATLFKRLFLTLCALPYFAITNRKKVRFYAAEILGMASGYILR